MRELAAFLIVVAFVAGCAKQPGGLTQASAPAPSGEATATGGPGGGGTVTGATPRTGASTPSRATAGTPPSGTRPEPREYAENAALEDIHFDFDRYAVRAADRVILDRHAAWLMERPDTLLLIEGHCDERGTAEYNISLGERRAKMTANYLSSRGVASNRITMISYGEQRPVCHEGSEACWAASRRAHFLVKRR